MTSKTSQYTSDNYEVLIGRVVLDDGSDTDGYHVRNLGTGIVEHMTTILPEAIMWAKTLSNDLNEHLAEEAAESATTH